MAFPYPHSARTARSPGPAAPAAGLYDPAQEHDACGVAFVADLHGRRSHASSPRASARSAGWTIAAPAARSRTPATAPAS